MAYALCLARLPNNVILVSMVMAWAPTPRFVIGPASVSALAGPFEPIAGRFLGFSFVASRMMATPRAIGSSGRFRGSFLDLVR